MTFAARTLMAGANSGIPVAGYNNASARAFVVSGGVTVTVSFNTDGTVSVSSLPAGNTNRPSNPSQGFPSNWFYPTTVGVGATGYWVRATYVSGDTVTGGSSAVGSWLELSSVRSWSMHVNTFGVEKSGVYTFEIATDSGGVTIVATGNIAFDAETAT